MRKQKKARIEDYHEGSAFLLNSCKAPIIDPMASFEG